MKTFLWWVGHCLGVFLSMASIFIGLRVLSIPGRDHVNFILSLTLLVVGVLLLIHFVGRIVGRVGEKIRYKSRRE